MAYIQTQGTFVTTPGGTPQEVIYSGSGFVVDPTGLIVTNNHVVTGGAFWKVAVGADKTLMDAQVVGVSECSDLAVLKVSGHFPALTMATTSPTVGETIYVAGHPNGDPYTLTNGIVAKPAAPADTRWASVQSEFQTTAQTFPGNSGSPVVNVAGQVIGVDYAGGIAGSAIAGESFAIGAVEAKGVVDQIIKTNGNLDYIGLNGEVSADNSGVAILSVAPGSPADKAGIAAGDLLTNLNGTAVGTDGTKATYCSVLRSHKPDATLSVTVVRAGQTWTGEINGRALALAASSVTPAPSSQPSSGGGGTLMDQIKPFVPANIWSTCSLPSPALGAPAIVGVVCSYAGVDAVEYILYDNPADLKDAYQADVTASGAIPATTAKTCDNANVFETWTRSSGSNSPDQGLLCEQSTSNGSVYSYIEQADPANNVLFLGMIKGDQRAALFTWWKANDTIIES